MRREWQLWNKALLTVCMFFIVLSGAACSNRSSSDASGVAQSAGINTASNPFRPVERDFLTNLAKNMAAAPAAEARINAVIQRLNDSPRLMQADYEFLINLSKRVKNKAIAAYLDQIANNHRP